jgi:hypothetical protein
VLSVDQTHLCLCGKSKKVTMLFDPINLAREKEKCKTKKSWVKKSMQNVKQSSRWKFFFKKKKAGKEV